jgi:CheY-like chemotaxis protein
MNGEGIPPASEDDDVGNALAFAGMKASGKLPSPEGVALDILHLSRQEYVSNAQITRVILADPALAERLIKAANMLVRGGKRTVISVSDAVSVLGLPVVVQLVLAFSLLAQNRAGPSKRFNYSHFWSRSLLLLGTAMQAIALRGRLTKTEEMFAWGLLCKCRSTGMANVRPNEYDDILERVSDVESSALRTLEQERLSIDHLQLTTMLLDDWGCPAVSKATLAINQLDTLSDEESRDYQFTEVMGLATALTTATLAEEGERQRLLPSLLLSAARSGIDGEDLRTVFTEVVSQWQEWGDLLELPTQDVSPFVAPSSQTVTGIQVKVSSANSNVDKATYPLRVLAVDDDPTILAVLKRLLTTAGHTVYTASNGAEALERALEVSPELVITDWVMPNKDGLQFCRELRATKLGKGMYVLLLTSFEDEERLVEAFEAGADDYVNKPFGHGTLCAATRSRRSYSYKGTTARCGRNSPFRHCVDRDQSAPAASSNDRCTDRSSQPALCARSP